MRLKAIQIKPSPVLVSDAPVMGKRSGGELSGVFDELPVEVWLSPSVP
jgi:hypothetical protein